MRSIYNPQAEELYEIKGDAQRGVAAQTNLDKAAAAHPQIRFQDKIITCDLYLAGDGSMTVHLYCPRCSHALSVDSRRKAIDWRPSSEDPSVGELSIEPFGCTWELEDARETKGPSGGHILISSGNLCGLRMAVEKNQGRMA